MNIIAIICAAIIAILGIVIFVNFGLVEMEWYGFLFGALLLFVGGAGLRVLTENFVDNLTYYLPAEPLAHNQTQTVFTTDKGTYIANGLYPDGTYLLTVDGKDVLVVWQAVDGENE